MALQLDLLTRVRNIKWAGGTFVVKTVITQIVCGSRRKWQSQNPPLGTFGGTFANSGSSTALIGDQQTPVFVISAKHENDNGDDGSVILASRDGKQWSMVFSKYEVNEGSFRSPWVISPTGIVWDKNEAAFFAAFYWVDFNVSAGIVQDGEAIYRSSDGRSWSQVSRNMIGNMTDQTPSGLVPHCNKPENEGGIPDGLQAYNAGTETFMKPTSLVGFSPINGALYNAESPSVTVKREGVVIRTTSASAPCYAVAQHGGIWVAAGGKLATLGAGGATGATLTIDVSTDVGQHWVQDYLEAFNPDTGLGQHAATVSANK